MQTTSEIWIAEDDRSLRWVMEKAIKREVWRCAVLKPAMTSWLALRTSQPEIIISDIRMPGIDGLELLKQIHATRPDIR